MTTKFAITQNRKNTYDICEEARILPRRFETYEEAEELIKDLLGSGVYQHSIFEINKLYYNE